MRSDIVMRIRAARYWIGVASLLVGAVTAGFFVLHPVSYQSTATVMFRGERPVQNEKAILPSDLALEASLLKLLATSTAVTDKMITQYGLYEHYFIDTLRPLHHEAATALLLENVRVSILSDASLSITVRDMDRAKAAQLAHGIFLELNAIVARHTSEYFDRQVKLNRDLLAYQESQSAKRLAELHDLGDRLAPLTRERDTRGLMAMEFEQQLAAISTHLVGSYSEMQSLGRTMQLLAAMDRDGLLGTLTLVNAPMQDVTTRPRMTIIWSILAAMITTALFSVVALVWWHGGSHETRDLLRDVIQPTGRRRDRVPSDAATAAMDTQNGMASLQSSR